MLNRQNKLTTIASRFIKWLTQNKLGILSCLFSFIIMLSFIAITLSRNFAIKQIKQDLQKTITALNEAGYDVSYKKIEFNNIFFYPLIKIEDFSIYNLKGSNLWNLKFNNITANTSLLNSKRINIRTSSDIKLSIDRQIYNFNTQNSTIELKYDKDYNFKSIEIYFDENQIKDIAKIRNITFVARSININTKAPAIIPSLETHVEFKDIKINGLINYPLASNIQRIYAQFNLMGKFDTNDSTLLAAENWLHDGGFIDIPSFNISWKPFMMVGRGNINFNEKFTPQIHLQTTSKALLEMLNELQEKQILERKGVFVANILLNAKAFKIRDKDTHLTITTPISYRDGKLAVENVTVKTTFPQKRQ